MKRNKSNKSWIHEHINDHYVKQAKKLGYRSRAAFKLEEITEQDCPLRPGMTVVDLGAAPGGWSQFAAQRVGASGKVIAVDILDMTGIHGVTVIKGDFTQSAVLSQVEGEIENGRPDLVICDMSPNLTGIALLDQARIVELAQAALAFAQSYLKPKGCLLVKLFHGVGFDAFAKELRACFKEVRIRKPKASRGRSHEVYLVGKYPVNSGDKLPR